LIVPATSASISFISFIAQDLADLDVIANLDKRGGVRARGLVERADDWRFNGRAARGWRNWNRGRRWRFNWGWQGGWNGDRRNSDLRRWSRSHDRLWRSVHNFCATFDVQFVIWRLEAEFVDVRFLDRIQDAF
jgi:hypothetical protein